MQKIVSKFGNIVTSSSPRFACFKGLLKRTSRKDLAGIQMIDDGKLALDNAATLNQLERLPAEFEKAYSTES